MKNANETILADIPDLTDWALANIWIQNKLKIITAMNFDKNIIDSFIAVTVSPNICAGPVLGPYSSTLWRRFVLGIFFSDWACYTKDADRADFARLVSVVATFPSGFRLWLCRLPDETYIPVGYTGWYPITDSIFELLLHNPASITHRGFMVPCRDLSLQGNNIYLFNYSIIPQLRKRPPSSLLLKNLAKDVSKINAHGIAAVTVSPDGIRVAERFGLRQTGSMTHDGEEEKVFAASFNPLD